MSAGIHGLLLKLHDSLSDEDRQSAALICHDVVGNLGQECMLTPTESELGKTVKSAPNSINNLANLKLKVLLLLTSVKHLAGQGALGTVRAF